MMCKSNYTNPKTYILIPGCKATKLENCQGGEYFRKPLYILHTIYYQFILVHGIVSVERTSASPVYWK